jgi:hypothetical protein
MAIVGAENLTVIQIVNLANSRLINHRAGLQSLEELHQWTAEITAADLEAPPLNMDPGTAQGLINAVADAHNEWVNHFSGLPAVLPATGYRYGDSQAAFIGPL